MTPPRTPLIGLLLAALLTALLAAASGCDDERRADCPEPPYTCTTQSACLQEGGTALGSYACELEGEICCDVP
jgi:hypothetical protein